MNLAVFCADIQSILIGVPAVWELIRKGILTKVDSSGGLKKSVFNAALSAKQSAKNYKLPFVANLTDAVVFNQVRQQTGGRLRYLFSGGGAVSRSTQEFITNSLTTMIQGRYTDSEALGQ